MNLRDRTLSIQTTDDFLRWNEGREGKREFAHGRVVEMIVGVSRTHWKLATRLGKLIGDALDDTAYAYGTADFGVRTLAGVRYPDFLVTGADGNGWDLATSDPILVAEILSPSSLAVDFGAKATEYTAIPSLQHYLVLSQDEPRVWLWTRTSNGFPDPVMTIGVQGSITLNAFDLTLSLADLYRGIA